MSVIVDFEPIRLQRARALVEAAHPGTATAPQPIGGDAMADLRRTVEQAAADGEKALVRLADGLSPRLVRGLVGGLESWEDLREPVAFLLRRRSSARLLPFLWTSWQRTPLLEELRTLLMEAGERWGWGRAVAMQYAGLAPSWVGAAEPGPVIQQWLDGQGLSWSHLHELADRPIRPDSPLARLVLIAILVAGSRNQLHEEAERLPDWHDELAPELRIAFGQNYLTKLPADLWDRTLLMRFRTTYGLPKKPVLERFWEPIPAPVRDRFQRIFIEQEIEEAFRGDTHKDRESFWRTWAGKIIDVERKSAGEVAYAYIEFEKFAVFEFFETGHAAYFYLPADATRVRKIRPSKPADLKDKKTRKDNGYRFVDRDNRLIHNPAWGWHPRGKRIVARWIRQLT